MYSLFLLFFLVTLAFQDLPQAGIVHDLLEIPQKPYFLEAAKLLKLRQVHIPKIIILNRYLSQRNSLIDR